MTRIIAPLHDRHAPTPLQEAFLDAVEAYGDWGIGASEPTVSLDERDVPISSVFGRLRNSDDILPEKSRLALRAVQPDWDSGENQGAETYSAAAKKLRELCLERLRDEAR